MALTPRALATSSGSISFPLYLKAELQAMTRNCRNCERALMRLSLIPIGNVFHVRVVTHIGERQDGYRIDRCLVTNSK